MRILLAAGADSEQKTSRGRTAADLARHADKERTRICWALRCISLHIKGTPVILVQTHPFRGGVPTVQAHSHIWNIQNSDSLGPLLVVSSDGRLQPQSKEASLGSHVQGSFVWRAPYEWCIRLRNVGRKRKFNERYGRCFPGKDQVYIGKCFRSANMTAESFKKEFGDPCPGTPLNICLGGRVRNGCHR